MYIERIIDLERHLEQLWWVIVEVQTEVGPNWGEQSLFRSNKKVSLHLHQVPGPEALKN